MPAAPSTTTPRRSLRPPTASRGSSSDTDAVVIHPTNWQAIRIAKDTGGQFFGGGRSSALRRPQGPASASQFSADTLGMRVWSPRRSPSAPRWSARSAGRRGHPQGVTVEATNSHSTWFADDISRFARSIGSPSGGSLSRACAGRDRVELIQDVLRVEETSDRAAGVFYWFLPGRRRSPTRKESQWTRLTEDQKGLVATTIRPRTVPAEAGIPPAVPQAPTSVAGSNIGLTDDRVVFSLSAPGVIALELGIPLGRGSGGDELKRLLLQPGGFRGLPASSGRA